MFKHELGCEIETKVQKLKGIITSRSENLYGCNRYFVQPKADKDGKANEGWWVDEDDIGDKKPVPWIRVPVKTKKAPGGPISKLR